MLEQTTEHAGCPACGGLGYITTPHYSQDGEFQGESADYCEECDGNGWVELAKVVQK